MTIRLASSAFALPLLVLASSCGGSTVTENQAAKGADPGPVATSSATAPTVKAAAQKVSNEFITWSLDYPAEVAAIPALAKTIADPSIAARKEVEAQARTDMPERKKMGAPIGPYEVMTKAVVVGNSPQMLSVTVTSYQFTGGAHGMTGTTPVLWDREQGRPVEFAALFPNGLTALNGAFHDSYCKALNAERAKRRQGMPPSDMANDPFSQCPVWKDLALIPEGPSGQRFNRIMIHADAYVAGPYAEGAYDIPVPVTKALIDAMAPEYRGSFTAS